MTSRAQESEETKKRERNTNCHSNISSNSKQARKARGLQLRSDYATARKDEVRKRATQEQISILERVVEQVSMSIPLPPKHPHDQN
jgi:preprotein translocase subunit SecD